MLAERHTNGPETNHLRLRFSPRPETFPPASCSSILWQDLIFKERHIFHPACGAGSSCSPEQAIAGGPGAHRPRRAAAPLGAEPGLLPRPGRRRCSSARTEALSRLSRWTFTLSRSALPHLRRQSGRHPLRKGNVSAPAAGAGPPGRASARSTARQRRCP